MLAVTSETEAGISGPKITHPFKGCVRYDFAEDSLKIKKGMELVFRTHLP